ncbi:DUF6234 family protein [Streptomyces sp. NPDC059008]|uniref:DUF6234 family protein n=1 Tax=Streptomyces sp. NPDC059008 TaxID=3346693 RepID=UPI0036C9B5EB
MSTRTHARLLTGRQDVAMTCAFPEPSPRRGRPWSRRTPRGRDVGIGIALFVVEAAVFLLAGFGYGMEVWAAQGEQARIDAVQLAQLAWMQYFFVAVVVCAGLAALFRAPWTVLSQLLAAGAVAVLFVLAQHDYDRSHPGPAPVPSAGYTPCYSGSERCD